MPQSGVCECANACQPTPVEPSYLRHAYNQSQKNGVTSLTSNHSEDFTSVSRFSTATLATHCLAFANDHTLQEASAPRIRPKDRQVPSALRDDDSREQQEPAGGHLEGGSAY